MKVHRNWWRTVATAAFTVVGIVAHDAHAQYSAYAPTQQTQVSYGYPTTGQPAVTTVQPQARIAGPPIAQAQIPTTAPAIAAQPMYTAYRTPAAPAHASQSYPQVAPTAAAPVAAQLPVTAGGPSAALPYQPNQYSTTSSTAPATRYPQYPQTAQIPTYPSAQSAPVSVTPAQGAPSQATQAATAQAPTYPSYTVTTYPATSNPAAGYSTSSYPTAGYPASATTAAGYPSYPQLARQSSAADSNHAEAMPAPVPSGNGDAEKAAPPADATMMPHSTMPGVAGGNGGLYPSTGYASACGSAGCATPSSCGYPDYGINGYFEQDGGHTWFGGVYFLWMERDNASPTKLAVRVDHDAVAEPYYPPADTTVLATGDYDFREGVEVRFGSTFSCGNDCDSGCGTGYGYGSACGGCSPPDNFAWEAAWWGIDGDTQWLTYVDQNPGDNTRMYGMRNFVGLQYDRDGDGIGWRPVNDYYGYGLPIDDPGAPVDGDLIVLAQRVRTDFWAQNLELNLVRFPICDIGCGNNCNSCGNGSGCGTGAGCGGNECGCEEESIPISFSMCGMCGVRYFRTNDDFFYGTEFAEWSGGAYDQGGYDGFSFDSSNELYYDIQIDNHLIGPQVGWYMNYCVASKWNFFCNSTFGIFNNHINHAQRLWSNGGGTVRYAGTGEEFRARSDKNDVAFLGELRVGGAYDITCNWRGVLAYRAVAITGVATSADQFPTDFTNSEYVQIIDSDASVVVHGLQAGFECRY